MKVSRQFDDFHIGTKALSQALRALGNNGKMLIKERRAEDVFVSLTGEMNEFPNLGEQHAKMVSSVRVPANGPLGG
jgi:hypothetical protein